MPESGGGALRLFEATGIEIELMIVDRESLAVRPLADELLRAKCGSIVSELENGDVAWSNELALHLVEMKTNGPAQSLVGLAERFAANVADANRLLAPLGAMLLPGGAHPWMDPRSEFRRWPHDYGAVYAAFDRIFDCSGHGWANLQSTHLNLPFSGDAEFGRLHAALRVLLPILPALAASSPILEGVATGLLDTRLEVYRTNARRVPSVSGSVVPEPVFTRRDYHEQILEPIYRDLAPFDPEGVLRHEWVNARGAIARFERSAIEIRVLDVQECPRADLAVAAAATAVARELVEERCSSFASQQQADTRQLAALLRHAARRGEQATLDRDTLALFGSKLAGGASAGALWAELVERVAASDAAVGAYADALAVILAEGCLARRILRRLGPGFDRPALHAVYAELAGCLAAGEMFRAAPG